MIERRIRDRRELLRLARGRWQRDGNSTSNALSGARLTNPHSADFLAPAVKVIVEVDGGYHMRRERADVRRDENLRRAGFRVVRVPAQLVLQAPAEAVALVRRALLLE